MTTGPLRSGDYVRAATPSGVIVGRVKSGFVSRTEGVADGTLIELAGHSSVWVDTSNVQRVHPIIGWLLCCLA